MTIQKVDLPMRDLVAGYRGDGDDSRLVEDNCQMLCRKCNRVKSAK